MVVKFTVYAWRDIMRVCGSITATCDKSQTVAKYIDLCFNGSECTAYGSNGKQISRVIVKCQSDGIPFDYHLLVYPHKTVAGTKTVEIHIDDEAKEYELIFLDDDNDIISASNTQFFDGRPFDYKHFCDKADRCLKMYDVNINPKQLISALEGLKSCDSVTLTFAGISNPFIITPYHGDDVNAVALVYPDLRIWDF